MLHQIGNGALGPVFRAFDSDRDRLVAVKLFRLDLPPERVHQLVAEFEKLIAADLQHPMIAGARATGIEGNTAYLAQDYVAADSLDIIMRERGRMPTTDVVRMAGQLASALDHAADRHQLHGALHPRDILLSPDDIRIVGLGVAGALDRVGVPVPVRRPYAAPERINDERWDRLADVFSLAAIVFELLCGRRVAGTGSEAADGLTDIEAADLASVQRVFALALASDPAYRFGSAAGFVEALKSALAVESAAIEPAAQTQAAVPKPRPKRPRARLRVVAQLGEEAAAAQPEDVPLPLAEGAAVPIAGEDPENAAPRARRKVPAPTPVAIETMATRTAEVDDTPAPPAALHVDLPPFVQPLTADTEPPEPASAPEPSGTPLEQAGMLQEEPRLLEEQAGLAQEEPRLSREEARLPQAQPRLHLEQPRIVPERVESAPEQLADAPESPVGAPERLTIDVDAPSEAAPLLSQLANLEERTVPPVSASGAAIWPIGAAAVLGIAIGFGAGYSVAIRDRAAVRPIAAAAPAIAPAVATPTPAAPLSASAGAPIRPPSAPAADPQAVSQPPKVARPAPAAFAGRVLVRSTPSGARVVVDGVDRGRTPATVRELTRGEHRIRIVREGFTAAERRVVLSPSQPLQSLSVRLARDPHTQAVAPDDAAPAQSSAKMGSIVIDSRPSGAAVLVDGRPVGVTPVTVAELGAGRHAIRLERDGYRTWNERVKITAGEQTRVTASLER